MFLGQFGPFGPLGAQGPFGQLRSFGSVSVSVYVQIAFVFAIAWLLVYRGSLEQCVVPRISARRLSLDERVVVVPSEARAVCADTQAARDWLGALVDFMLADAQGRCLSAVEVGVPARIAVVGGGVVMNAHVLNASPERVRVDFEGGESRDFAAWVNVSYLDERLRVATRVFRGLEGECVQWTFT